MYQNWYLMGVYDAEENHESLFDIILILDGWERAKAYREGYNYVLAHRI